MFYILNNDGWNVGVAEDFSNTWLEFESFEDAQKIVSIWNKWAGL